MGHRTFPEMNYPLDIVFQLLLGSAVAGSILCWLSIRFAPVLNLLDYPGSAEHKIHTEPTPITGGLVLLTATAMILYWFGPVDVRSYQAVIMGALVVGIFGIWDDLKHLPAWVKLIGQLAGIVVIIHMDVHVKIFNSPEFIFRTETGLDTWLNLGLTVFWMVMLTNAFNFIDSFDGLAIGLGGLSTAFFLIVSVAGGQVELALFCAIILGVAIALYFFNSHPARLFLGDSGAQALGFILAAIAIIYQPKAVNQLSSWFVPILIFGVPLFDFFLVILSRLRRKKWIHKAAKDHIYHRLTKMGVPLDRAVLLLHVSSVVLSIIGFLCLNLEVKLANTIFVFILALGVGTIVFLERKFS